MKLHTLIPVKILLFANLAAASVAECWQLRWPWEQNIYYNCPTCGNDLPHDQPNAPGKVLNECGKRDLTLTQCAHHCKCHGGRVKCIGLGSCDAETVTNYCYCDWDHITGQCVPGTENKKTVDGGRCWCPEIDKPKWSPPT